MTTDASSAITLNNLSSEGAITLTQLGGGDFTISALDSNEVHSPITVLA